MNIFKYLVWLSNLFVLSAALGQGVFNGPYVVPSSGGSNPNAVTNTQSNVTFKTPLSISNSTAGPSFLLFPQNFAGTGITNEIQSATSSGFWFLDYGGNFQSLEASNIIASPTGQFYGNGAGVTNLNAAYLATGIVPPSSINPVDITNLVATNGPVLITQGGSTAYLATNLMAYGGVSGNANALTNFQAGAVQFTNGVWAVNFNSNGVPFLIQSNGVPYFSIMPGVGMTNVGSFIQQGNQTNVSGVLSIGNNPIISQGAATFTSSGGIVLQNAGTTFTYKSGSTLLGSVQAGSLGFNIPMGITNTLTTTGGHTDTNTVNTNSIIVSGTTGLTITSQTTNVLTLGSTNGNITTIGTLTVSNAVLANVGGTNIFFVTPTGGMGFTNTLSGVSFLDRGDALIVYGTGNIIQANNGSINAQGFNASSSVTVGASGAYGTWSSAGISANGAGITNVPYTDSLDAFDAANAANFGNGANIQTINGGNNALAACYYFASGSSLTPYFKGVYNYSHSPLTNFNLTITITSTNAGWTVTNNYSCRFNTNGGANGFGSYQAFASNNIAQTGTSNNFITTNFTFNVPYGILTNTINIQPQIYNNGSSNELFFRFVLVN